MADIAETKLNQLEREEEYFVQILAAHTKKEEVFCIDLPMPLEQPLSESDLLAINMTQEERQVFDNLRGSEEIFILLRSETKIDTGNWLKKSYLWLACTKELILLWAVGQRDFSTKVPFTLLQKSLYNHITRELILFPAPKLLYKNIKVSPEDGFQILAQIYKQNRR